MTTRTTLRLLPLVLAATIVGACDSAAAVPPGSAPAASAAPSPSAVAPGRAPVSEPSSPPDSAPESTPPREETPSPETSGSRDHGAATPPAANRAHWSRPSRIGGANCAESSFTIDGRGGYHVAAVCGDHVRVFSSADGRSWTRTTFDPPRDRLERDPQLAVDGDTLYLATSRLAPEDGGCGDDGLRDVGVFYRTRHLPGGAWSSATRIGLAADSLAALRVDDGVLHAIVSSENGLPLAYESIAGSTTTRIELPHAGDASLRVGDDAHARIAYSTGDRIVYARVAGNELVKRTIASARRSYLMDPVLVLGSGNAASLLWTQNRDDGGGCASPGPGPRDGTYFATNAGGSWVTRRLSRSVGPKSLTVDPATGRVHVVLWDAGLRYLTLKADGSWSERLLRGTKGMGEPIIRLDPARNRIVVVMSSYDDGLFIVTRG